MTKSIIKYALLPLALLSILPETGTPVFAESAAASAGADRGSPSVRRGPIRRGIARRQAPARRRGPIRRILGRILGR